MEHYPKFLKGIALAALASVLLCGAALAVPSPSYPNYNPGSDAALTSATPAATHSASDARILFRTSNRPLARGTFRNGGGSLAGNVASVGTTTSSRSKTRYMLSGMVLAALTPLAIHHFGEPGDKSVAVQTQTPGSSSLANLGDAISTGNGHGRGGDKGHGGGGGDGDGGDCNNDTGGDDGGEVCDTGDHGDHGDNGGDCDNGGGCDNGDNGGDNGGDCGGDNGSGGGDHGGGGTSLPEPGTVPLVGAGLMMALAFRSRRGR